MAALWEAPAPRLVDLRQVRADLLEPVLLEEIRQWKHHLHWDFNASADLVRRFVQMHALNGYALLAGGRPVGYSYYVCEERKGLVGDLYVLGEFRTPENENLLLGAVLGHLMNNGYTRRVECQLLMLEAAGPELMPAAAFLTSFRRIFMTVELAAVAALPRASAGPEIAVQEWAESRQEEAAQVIAAAYDGHVDAEINDQYRSAAGARHFLLNIVQYPGCGTFHQPSSWVAYDTAARRACGVCLASLVAPEVGHITQICVHPDWKGRGVGFELLRCSLRSLAAAGSQTATLTVTASNDTAVRLYERVGFETLRQFSAFVWEGF